MRDFPNCFGISVFKDSFNCSFPRNHQLGRLNARSDLFFVLKIVNVVTGMELSELKTFPNAPERILVSSSAIKLDHADHGKLQKTVIFVSLDRKARNCKEILQV